MPLDHELILGAFVDPVMVVDGNDQILYANEAVEDLLGWTAASLVGRPLATVQPARLGGSRAGSFADHVGSPLRVPMLHRNGSEVDVEASLTTIDDDGAGKMIVACLRDARKRLELERGEERLRDRLEFLSAVTRALAGGVLAFDRHGRIAFANAAAEEMLGFTEAALAGQDVHHVVHGQGIHDAHQTPSQCPLFQALQSHLTARVADDVFTRRNGIIFPVAYTVAPLEMQGYTVGGTLAFQDMTERKQVEEAVKYQALHDALTDLPNRVLLEDRLNQAVLTARREKTPVTLLFMDLDRFKQVNDTLGHEYGDLVLRETGQRLRGALRGSDTVARLGGDEFAIVLPGTDDQGAIRTVRKILGVLCEPFTLHRRRFDVGASIGVAIYPQHGAEVEELMRSADAAMYAAKRAHRGYAIYRPQHDLMGSEHAASAG